MKEFLDTPHPDKCVMCGPRLTVKFSHAQLFGTDDETKLYRRLCDLCCGGGEDQSYYPLNKQEPLVAKSFEFPFIPIQFDDDEETAAQRLNYHHAVDALLAEGYRCITGNFKGYTDFFKGFED